ncbi:MAG TPA: crossover junction endodeoxyribonuclease RuvC [Thermodesulfobacteriota bacterium]|nr:crossover junction endodeoxyribonuclease RuvC [Thermodesulfobacteriota bacterium]
MRILGIDPGSHFTGYGVVTKGLGGKLSEVTNGRIMLDPEMPLPLRLLKISEGLNWVIRKFKPEAVAIESMFFARNAKSAIVLGHARGVALMICAANGLEVYEYAPKTVKAALTGHGAASKEQMQRMIKLLLSAEADSSDAADALAVAICHIHHQRTGLTVGAINPLSV